MSVLWRALLLSLVVHLAALGWGGALPVTPPLPGGSRLVVRMADPVQPSGAPVAGEARDAALRLPSKAKLAAARPVLPSQGRSTAAVDSRPERRPEAVGPAADAAAADRRADDSGDAVSADGIRRYRLSLARESRRFRRYPDQARVAGWQGVAVIRLEAATGTMLPVVSLEHSSGHEALDAQALAMMESAVQSAALPEALRGRRFGLSLPVHYRLDE